MDPLAASEVAKRWDPPTTFSSVPAPARHGLPMAALGRVAKGWHMLPWSRPADPDHDDGAVG